MFKTWSLRIIIGLILIIVVIVMTAPSQLMESQLESNVQGLKVASSEGDFWSGKFNQIRFNKHSIETLSWHLSGPSLLTASIGVDLEINDPIFNGSLFIKQSITGNSLISEVNGKQTVSNLSRIWPMIRFVSPTGELDWNDVSIAFNNEQFNTASGSIKWIDAELLVNNQSIALGEVMASFDVENNELVITLNSDEQFDLQANIIVSRNNQYKITASIKEDIPQNIYHAVKLMSQSDGNGRLLLTTSGRW